MKHFDAEASLTCGNQVQVASDEVMMCNKGIRMTLMSGNQLQSASLSFSQHRALICLMSAPLVANYMPFLTIEIEQKTETYSNRDLNYYFYVRSLRFGTAQSRLK